jgi:hypothetical protein
MKFDTAIREYVRQRIKEIGQADLLIGIPTYNNEETIGKVISTASEGLSRHYPGYKGVIFVSDGGSVDYTREIAQQAKVPQGLHKIVTIYRGIPGKGTALRAIFESAARLKIKACAIFDADLKSITPEWVKSMIEPTLRGQYDLASPYYVRHKYDATITNNIAYSLTRALYGKRLRQPIGGDFGFSPRLTQYFAQQDVWDTDIARFGVDIWMTTTALNEGFKVCESWLGVKLHNPKDPASSLGPMFRQLIGTIFGMMPKYEHIWTKVKGSHKVKLIGSPEPVEPLPVEVSVERLIENYKIGFTHFGALWREIVMEDTFRQLSEMAKQEPANFRFPIRTWIKVVYDFAYTYLRWAKNRYKLIEIMTPLYHGRIGAFVLETAGMSTAEVEREIVERQAELFEAEKPYLLDRMQS